MDSISPTPTRRAAASGPDRRAWIAAWLGAIGFAASVVAAPAPPDFSRDVRPILSQKCFKCHGPDDAARKGKLRLDLRDAAMQPAKSGAIAIVPGNSKDSALVTRIGSADPDEQMPPPSSKIVLADSEKDILRRWIAGGAEYRDHWAFVPPRQAPLPAVSDRSWARQPFDAFVLARLDKERLKPSPEANRHALARRVHLDLIGLPPTPEEADAFVDDASPEAYERMVDRLLGSKQYGERWARRWMDLARYADSNGYEKDRQRSIWPWRDWLVGALNADMPFDRFTIEQLAGDLLPGATRDQIVATGFHRNTMLNEEGGIDPQEFRFHATVDRVNTTATTWLALTLGCAQCHTHKYDPIPHREYYSMMAFLNNVDEPDLELAAPDAAEKHRANLREAAARLAELPGKFPVAEMDWETPRPARAVAAGGQVGRILDDGSALFAEPAPEKDVYTIGFESDGSGFTGLRLEALTDDALPAHGPGRVKHGNFVLGEIVVTVAPRNGNGPARPVKLSSATADAEQSGFPVGSAFDGNPTTGWAVHADGKTLNAPHTATFAFAEPVGFPGGTRFTVTLDQSVVGQHSIGRPRLSVGRPAGDASTLGQRRAAKLEERFAAWRAEGRKGLARWVALHPTELKSNSPKLTRLPDESVLASGDITKSDTYEVRLAGNLRGTTALRLEAMPDESLPHRGPGMAFYEGPKGDFFLGMLEVEAGGKALKFSGASESYGKNGFGSNGSAAQAIDEDPQTGWSTSGREGERHEAVFVLAEPLGDVSEIRVTMRFGRHYACSLGRFRVSATDHIGGAGASKLPEEVQGLFAKDEERWTAAERQRVYEEFLLSTPELSGPAAEIARLRKPESPQVTMVMRERPADNPRATQIHARGEYLRPGEPVEPGVPGAIAAFPAELPRNRLGLARWLVSSNNPLTARVAVNRQWQAFFGRGLVRTSEDFGYQGELPSHPELLDWLAVEFQREGWSMKKLHRSIVLSATYRQSSRPTPELARDDPENRLLARGPSGRLEAEIIRDSALRAAGLLSPRMGGPGVYPPQPSGVTEVAYSGAAWPTSSGEDRYRRSVYTFVKRTAPFALFNTFDAPTGESCLARRDSSDTPLQALALLNDVQFVEISQAFGKQLAAESGSDAARARRAFRRCLTRPPADEEVAALTEFLRVQRGRLAGGELDAGKIAGGGNDNAVERAAWTLLARVLLNLDEMVTKG